MKKKLFYLLVIIQIGSSFNSSILGQTGLYVDLFIGPRGAQNEVGLLSAFPVGSRESFGIWGRLGRPISFILHDASDNTKKAFDIQRGYNDDITLNFPAEKKMNRFTAGKDGYFGFFTGNRGITDDSVSVVIGSGGRVGIGIESPISKFHVHDGAISYTEPFGTHPGTFNIRPGFDNDRFWMGTQSEHILTIGTNAKGMVNFFPEGYTVFYKSGGDAQPLNISQANRNKYALFVMGGILSEDYAIGPKDSWADFVFRKDYRLASLKEVETYISDNGHLPDMPSGTEVQQEGYNLHEMNVRLLQKVEELTLYVINQSKEIERLNRIAGKEEHWDITDD